MNLSLWTRAGAVLVLLGVALAFLSPAWAGLALIGVALLLYAGINRLDQRDRQHRASAARRPSGSGSSRT